MSIILEAMKRSKEQDSIRSDVPTVDTIHDVPEPEPRYPRHWAVALGGGLLVAGLLVAGFLLIEGLGVSGLTPAPPSVSSTEAPQKSAIGPAQSMRTTTANDGSSRPPSWTPSTTATSATTGAPGRKPVELPAGQKVPTVDASVRSVIKRSAPSSTSPAGVSTDRTPASAVASAGGSPNQARSARDTSALEALYGAMNAEAEAEADEGNAILEGATPEDRGEADVDTKQRSRDVRAPGADVEATESTVDFADILARAQEELGVTPLVDSSEPLLETLSQQTRDQIPTLIYSEHNFRPSGRSSVVLNGKEAGEKERAGRFLVVEILPDSVVLRWRETQFRVRARNSWVNM